MKQLRIQKTGDGPNLVMLHGWGMHSGLWQDHMPWLQQHFTVHRVDLPGHGINTDVTLPTAMDVLCSGLINQIPEGHLLGWSLGGLVAQQLAMLDPSRCTSLVLIASSPCFLKRSDWSVGMDPAVFDAFAIALNRDTMLTLDRFIGLEVHGCDTMKQDLKRLKALIREVPLPTTQALKAGIQLLQQTDLRQSLVQLDMPVLLMGGNRDRLVSPDSLRQTQQLIKGSELCIIPRAGHAPFIGHPNQFKMALQKFMTAAQVPC